MIRVKISEYAIVVIVLVINRNIRNTTILIDHCCHQDHQSPKFKSSGFSHFFIFTICRLMPSRSFIFTTTRYQRWQNGVINWLQILRWRNGVTNLHKVFWWQNVWITNQPQPQRAKKIQKHNWKLVTSIGTSLLGANKNSHSYFDSRFEMNLTQTWSKGMPCWKISHKHSLFWIQDKLGMIEKASLKKKVNGRKDEPFILLKQSIS